MNSKENIVNSLNKLLEMNYDARLGYEECANHTDDQGFKNYFQKRVFEREKIISKLNAEITALGGTAVSGGSTTGVLHRIWIDIKNLVNSSDNDALLEECIKGEKAFMNAYRETMKKISLPETLRIKLIKQLNEVESTLEMLEVLEH